MAIKLIGLDIDGTLLNSKHEISPPVLESLDYAAGRGVHIVPVTGRPYLGVPLQLRQMSCISHIISSNGASTWNRGQLESGRRIGASLCLDFLREVEGLYSVAEFFMDGVGYVSADSYESALGIYAGSSFLEYFKSSRQLCREPERLLEQRGELEELALRCSAPEQCREILRRMEDFPGLKAALPTPFYMEIMSQSAGKGRALKELGASLGVETGEMMALGDSDNDREMLETVGFPVAMGNAVEELKKMACHVTADNENHGVAQAIYRFLPIEGKIPLTGRKQ